MISLLVKNSSTKKIEINDETYDICHAILRQRQKKRWEILDLVLSFIRMIMLFKSLKIKRYKASLKLTYNIFSKLKPDIYFTSGTVFINFKLI